MNFASLIKDYADLPISRHLILEVLKGYKRPNDKISALLKSGLLISLKKGLYVVGPSLGFKLPEPFLIANHLWGPSYVSLDSALSYWGFIPERVYEVSSVTLKPSKKYETLVGRFSYKKLQSAYYSNGIERVKLQNNQSVLMAAPEKALCDKIVLTPNIYLRSMQQTFEFLTEDLRIDIELIKKLNTNLMGDWILYAPKKNSLKMLIKTINAL